MPAEKLYSLLFKICNLKSLIIILQSILLFPSARDVYLIFSIAFAPPNCVLLFFVIARAMCCPKQSFVERLMTLITFL